MKRQFLLWSFLLLISGCQREPDLTTQSSHARAAYLRGVDLWQKFYYVEAKSAFEEAIRNDSTFAMAWARLAMVELASQDEPEAKADIQTALSLSRRATQRERLYISMWNYRVHFQLAQSALAADSLMQLFPDEPEPYVFRGMLYELNKNLDAAIELYRRAVGHDSTFVPAVMSLGYAYSSANQQEEAIAQMARYIRLAPDAADPRASYADLLFRVGRYREALDQYRKSLELKEDYWYAVNRIGEINAVLGRLDDAERQFDRGFALIPHNQQLEASHISADAALNIRRGQFRKAVTMYDQAIAFDSTNMNAGYGLVYALTELQEFERAHQIVQDIYGELERRNLTTSSVMVGYHLMRARLLAEEGNLKESIAACDEAFDFSSPLTRAEVYRQEADVFLKQGLYENAFDALENALRINPNNPQALLILAKVYHAKKDSRMTAEIGGRLLKLWDNADADFRDLAELKKLLSTRIYSGVR